MSTTAKGDKFEEKIFAFFTAEINAGKFWARAECCKVFRKKGYYSHRRQDDIIFDISIEIGYPGSSAYSLLYLIECKDLGRKVPADDVEEFSSKIEQVAGLNVKGMLASTNLFQRGALRFAKSTGIALLRYIDELNFTWILNRSSSIEGRFPSQYSRWSDVHNGLTMPDLGNREFRLHGYVAGTYTNSLCELFLHLAPTTAETRSVIEAVENPAESALPLVGYVCKAQIEKIATDVLKEVAYAHSAVWLNDVCTWQSKTAGLTVHTGISPNIEESRHEILGCISFSPLEITIYLHHGGNEARERFTLAHELGHHFLGHSKYMKSEYCQEGDFESNEVGPLSEDIRRMEWQAKYFASCLLLPKEPLVKDLMELAQQHSLVDRGFGLLYVDEQECNRKIYHSITDFLKYKYRVSRAAIGARLQGLGLLKDNRERKMKPLALF